MAKSNKEKVVLGKLDKFFKDPDVLRIFVDGPARVYYEKKGKIIDADFKLSTAEIEKICAGVLFSVEGAKWHKGIHMLDLRLNDGAKFIAVLQGLSVKGPSIIISKIPSATLGWEKLKEYKSLDDNAKKIIEKILATDSSVVIAGNRNSGKTTIANCIANSIPENRRLVVIEKNLQMRITHPRSLVLEIFKDDNFESRSLAILKSSPNFAPDWLVTSDITGRDGSEVVNLMRSGIACLTTMHAEDVIDCLKRLEYMCLGANPGLGLSEVRGMIASGLKYVVFQAMCADGVRRITKIVKIASTNGENFQLDTLYFWNEDTKSFELTLYGKNFLT